ncbi:MAG: hypothetical protein KY432_05860 [Acidobacteria bacterium]|nr:hypothetical protein [Acidobacteriota bacterium]
MSPFEAVIPITMFLVIGFVITSFLRARQTKQMLEAQARFHDKILDRFGSSQDLIAFVQTAEGRRFLERFGEQPLWNPMERSLSSIRTGIIITFLGAGMITIGALLGIRFDENGALLIGLVGVFLGAGFLVAAYASHRLARQWGLFDGKAVENTNL